MKRIIITVSLAVMLFVGFSTTAFAQGPYCQPNDQWCQAAQRAGQWGQQAQYRLQSDWNNVGRDLGVQQQWNGVQQGWGQFQNAAQRGSFFNCTQWATAANGSVYCVR